MHSRAFAESCFSLRPGILARDIPSDVADLAEHKIAPITVVVCNLYPFNETVARIPPPTIAEAVEEVDIGGVTLLRAAAKNHGRVVILSDPKDYDEFLSQWKSGNGSVTEDFRRRMAVKVSAKNLPYDDSTYSEFLIHRHSLTLLPTTLLSPTTSVVNTLLPTPSPPPPPTKRLSSPSERNSSLSVTEPTLTRSLPRLTSPRELFLSLVKLLTPKKLDSAS